MSYAGHVLDMIQRMRNNRELLKKRDRLFTGLSKKIAHNYRHHPAHQKELSPEQRTILREKLIRENRIDLTKKIVAFFLAVSIVSVLFLLLRGYLDLNDFLFYGN
nr:hypothetical protein [uncultured Carboxylicivirga sp.]